MKIKNNISAVIVLLYAIFFCPVSAKENGENGLIVAMTDELKRNMDSLRLDGYANPVFISYNLSDIYSYQVASSLGATYMSDPDHVRNSNVRLLVGSYELNDENYYDQNVQTNHDDGSMPIPLDDNYLGLRKAFWLMTNNVFKSASELHKNKLLAMKQKGSEIDSFLIPDFSPAPTQQFYGQPIKVEINSQKFDSLTNQVSAIFTKHPQIIDSKVILTYQNVTEYFVNSEGSKMILPSQLLRLIVVATILNVENEAVTEFVTYYSESANELPTVSVLEQDVNALIGNLTVKSKLVPFTESYAGPVLIEGNAVPEMLFNRLFTNREGVVASRIPLVNDPNRGLVNPPVRTWDSRMGTKVISKDFTIIDLPKTKMYKGEKLFGYTPIDREAVIPNDSLTIIENGILKNMLNSRTPTAKCRQSTGNVRSVFGLAATGQEVTPTNILVTSSKKVDYSELKSTLITNAKENGLAYALIVRPITVSANFAPVNYYKVDVKTGKETLIRSLNTSKITSSDLNKVVASGNKSRVYHTLLSRGAKGMNLESPSIDGTPISYIYPDGVLIEELILDGEEKSIKRDAPLIPRP